MVAWGSQVRMLVACTILQPKPTLRTLNLRPRAAAAAVASAEVVLPVSVSQPQLWSLLSLSLSFATRVVPTEWIRIFLVALVHPRQKTATSPK